MFNVKKIRFRNGDHCFQQNGRLFKSNLNTVYTVYTVVSHRRCLFLFSFERRVCKGGLSNPMSY